jgi:hypothetical protein
MKTYPISLFFFLATPAKSALNRNNAAEYILKHPEHTYAPRRQVVDNFMNFLKIPENPYTNPVILNDLLLKEMRPVNILAIRSLLKNQIEHKTPLNPMIQQITNEITHNHPKIIEFLREATEKKLLPKNPDPITVDRLLNYMFLLDHIVRELAKDPELFKLVLQHFKVHQLEIGIHPDFFQKFLDISPKIGFFGAIKTLTIDLVAQMIIMNPAPMKLAEKLSLDLIARRSVVFINIMEATLTDAVNGMFDNTKVGLDLAFNQKDDQQWMSQYVAWNIAFVIRHLNNPNILISKLLLLSVITASPAEFLYFRFIALRLSVEFYIFAQWEGMSTPPLTNHCELAQIAGKINANNRFFSYPKDESFVVDHLESKNSTHPS